MPNYGMLGNYVYFEFLFFSLTLAMFIKRIGFDVITRLWGELKCHLMNILEYKD